MLQLGLGLAASEMFDDGREIIVEKEKVKNYERSVVVRR